MVDIYGVRDVMKNGIFLHIVAICIF